MDDKADGCPKIDANGVGRLVPPPLILHNPPGCTVDFLHRFAAEDGSLLGSRLAVRQLGHVDEARGGIGHHLAALGVVDEQGVRADAQMDAPVILRCSTAAVSSSLTANLSQGFIHQADWGQTRKQLLNALRPPPSALCPPTSDLRPRSHQKLDGLVEYVLFLPDESLRTAQARETMSL